MVVVVVRAVEFGGEGEVAGGRGGGGEDRGECVVVG